MEVAVPSSPPFDTTPIGAAVNPVTSRIYAARGGPTGGTFVSVIDGATNTIIATTPIVSRPLGEPAGVAVTPATNRVYVANRGSNTVSVIDGARNTVVATISLVVT